MKVILSEIQVKRLMGLITEAPTGDTASTTTQQSAASAATGTTSQPAQTTGNAERGQQMVQAFDTAGENLKGILSQYGIQGDADDTTPDDYDGQGTPYAEINGNVSVNQGWLSVVKNVWGKVFVGPVFNGKYNQGKAVGAQTLRKAGLSRATKSRSDCSGFVFTCLQEFGALPSGTLGNTTTLDKLTIPGFQKTKYTGNYSQLPAGTILTYKNTDAGTRSGHTMILGPTPGKGWSFGSSKRPGSGVNGDLGLPLRKPYKWAFIPSGNAA